MKKLRRMFTSLMLRMRRGVLMDSFITLRCNYKCHYCPFLIKGWKYNHNERPIEDWVNYINNNVPYPIKRMAIMGGEPSVVDWVGAYVNFLVNKKIGVTVYTNLHNISNFKVIVPSPYLWFNACRHEKYTDHDRFTNNLTEMRKAGYNVKLSKVADDEKDVHVVTGNGLLREADYQTQPPRLRIAPDLTIHPRCWDIAKHLRRDR